MIEVSLVTMDYKTVATVWLREKPAIGEMVVAGADAWRIIDVQHKVRPGWQPIREQGDPPHTVIAYCEQSEPEPGPDRLNTSR